MNGKTSPNLSADPQPGEPLAWSCTSDVISISESLASMSLWALALPGLAGVLPHWKNPATDKPPNPENR